MSFFTTGMSNFKIIVIAIFSVCIVVAIALFALSKASSTAQVSYVTVWGTISTDTFTTAFNASSLFNSKTTKVSYVQKSPATFDSDFVNALADGNGPDVVILRDDSVYKNRARLFVIPYASYTARTFKDTFIEEGEMFLSPNGVVALPFIVDPLVMYWNRDMFSNAVISEPPK